MSETARPLCVIGSDEHEAHDGTLLCRGHLERLGVLLRDIEDEAIRLEVAPSLAIAYERTGGTALASEQAPARLNVIAMRDWRTRPWERDDEPRYTPPTAKSTGPWCLMCDHDSCTAWRAGRRRDLHDDEHDAGSDDLSSVLYELHNWARLVREERALSQPEWVTVTGERDTLTRQLDWCARQPWVDELYRDMTTLVRQLKRANNTLELPVGKCGTFYGPDQCDGQVWHIVIRHDGEPDEPGFRCATCRRVWTGTEAVRKRDDLWRDEQTRKVAQR